MRYLPHTQEEIESMLAAVGASSLDDLFSSIPAAVRTKTPLDLRPALDETTLLRHLGELASHNAAANMLSFLGAGAYDHVFPQAADQLLLRSELYTSYTPYQAEVAQGTLQIIFEFQTIVSEVLGLPVANASMYDASTAAAEAALMARRLTKRDRMLISGCIHPQYRETIATYTRELDHGEANLAEIAARPDGCTDVDALIAALDDTTACVVVGYPTFYGAVCDLSTLVEATHRHGAQLVTVTAEPFALALIKSPGELGADIAVAEGQPLGLPPQYGGPGVGLFACQQDRKVLQQMPGRLCGETLDSNGKRGFVLTLSTREQHIRRERATSNICTNSGLCATALTLKMCMLGKQGFIAAADRCLAKAQYLRAQVEQLAGYRWLGEAPTFNEMTLVVRGGDASKLAEALAAQGIIAGLPLGDVEPERQAQLLVAVTEKHTRADLDRLAAALASYPG